MKPIKMLQSAIAITALAALTACDASQVARWGSVTSAPETQKIDEFARGFLNSIQAASISDNQEYCGYFVSFFGRLSATDPQRGTVASCEYGIIPLGAVASYHTHGSYSPRYDNEVPSIIDQQSAIASPFDDYVSTPGGRLWRVSNETGEATQLCGLGCLVSDPNFVPQDEDKIRQTYTVETLRARQGDPRPVTATVTANPN